ncbi:hypothetical protein B0H17DRAFT_1048752 [Mycena rosella]|uniref:Uncharacterized protein n=1 Tax=Mycena rosella TaxID=1033263 RepID=A0AAD7DWW0_MYCRO|nr:hypothetical protein B0H17DRAFT_1048752 [Mycena rosella]
MAIAGLDETTTSFSVHPDYRQVSSFALGWVFITSLSAIISSVLIQRLFGFIRGRSASSDAERSVVSEKQSLRSLDIEDNLDLRHGYSNTALFALPLCFLFASVAQFASLLAFPLNGDATCAFVVAWGGMAAQSGRLVGALIVIFDLRKMGIARWEFWVAIVWLIIGIGFIFLNNAVSVGLLTPFTPLGVAYCDRKHFLPASLVSSILYFSLEVYAIARVMLLLASKLSMREVIRDIRVLRPAALLLLELLTLVPSAVFTNIVAEFVPFSIGAVAVLLAFEYKAPRPVETPRLSTLSYVTYPSVRHSTMQSTRRSSHSQSIPPPPSPPPRARRHPFSAIALSDPTIQTDDWNPPLTARSTRTIDSIAAQSITNAVVQVGQRARAASRSDDGPFDIARRQDAPASGTSQSPWAGKLSAMIVPSQAAYAERLDLDYAQANSLSARPRPTITTPPPPSSSHEDDVSDLISPASRIRGPNFRLSRLGGVQESTESAAPSRRTSYRTSFLHDSDTASPNAARASMPIPLHDSRSIYSSERRRSTSLSLTQESSVDHRRSVSIPTPARWPTFNGNQFRAAGYGPPARSRASSASSVHRPPPLPLPSLPSAGIRQAQTPRGPRPPPLSAASPRFNLAFS